LSPRGWRFTERYGDRITYVEADLPDMAEHKRQALERMGSLSDRHRVEDLDALRDEGPGSLQAVAANLDRSEGLAIITEGLLSYLEHEAVLAMWRRFAQELERFPSGFYFSDVAQARGLVAPLVRVFMLGLSVLV